MENKLKYVTAITIGMIYGYIFTSFIYASTDYMNWGTSGRIICLVLQLLGVAYMVGLIKMEEDE